MLILFFILIILASLIISFFILVQNPKGGGLAGNIAGFSTHFMGVKQTTDVLEKGTWILAIIIALLSIFSAGFMSQGAASGNEPNLRPTTTTPAPVTPTPGPAVPPAR